VSEQTAEPVGLLTDEIRALVGVRSAPRTARVPLSADALRRFVHAVMEEDPVHWDPEIAEDSRYAGVVAPPLYPMHVWHRAPGLPDPLEAVRADPQDDGLGMSRTGAAHGLLPGLGLPLPRLLNGGTEAEFFQLARVGDVITTQAEYLDIRERRNRRGEPMVIVRARTTYTNQDGATLATITSTTIQR
jgi:acyl dehydratase